MLLTVDSENVERAAEQLWSWLQPDLRHLKSLDQDQIQLAFMQMVQSHNEQRRKNW
jgi:hypothetical protein